MTVFGERNGIVKLIKFIIMIILFLSMKKIKMLDGYFYLRVSSRIRNIFMTVSLVYGFFW